MSPALTTAFRSLGNSNYRLWAGGAIVSNVGTWMQRTAQDWIVLAELTHHSASAVGIVMGLQFGPQLLLLPITGYVADHFDRRRVLLITQILLGVLATGLGLLTITGIVQLWHVYVFAFLLGCVAAFDAPARQSFVSELVGDAHLSNAVALNSTSFNAARMIGPALAGILIAAVGTGWVFLINGLSYAATICSLALLRRDLFHVQERATRSRSGLADGFRYAWTQHDIRIVLVMFFLIGTFGVNFPIFISTMAVSVFHVGAGQFGLLTSMMAIGSVCGAFLSAHRDKPRPLYLVAGAGAFGVGLTIAALMPGYTLFGIALTFVGLAAQTFSTTALGAAQLWTEPMMRGRIIAIVLAVGLGGTPLGAPFVGWVADTFGPRWSLGVGAAAGFAAALVGWLYFRSAKPAGLSPAAPSP